MTSWLGSMVVEEQSRGDGGAVAQRRSDDAVCGDEDARIAEMCKAWVIQREMCIARVIQREMCRARAKVVSGKKGGHGKMSERHASAHAGDWRRQENGPC